MESEKNKLNSWPEDVFCDPMVLRRDDKNGVYLFCSACGETGTRGERL